MLHRPEMTMELKMSQPKQSGWIEPLMSNTRMINERDLGLLYIVSMGIRTSVEAND